MNTGFVVHPDGTVDPPTLSPEEFAACETPLAWSAVEPDELDYPEDEVHDEPLHHRWAGVIKVAAAIAAVALGATTAVALVANPPDQGTTTAVTQTVTPSSPTREADPAPDPGPFVMPTVMASHETQDGDYLNRVRLAGLASADPLQAIKFAHMSCANLARGFTVRQIAINEFVNYHEMPVSSYGRVIEIAAAVYCPEQG
jgi:hypothetical protein